MSRSIPKWPGLLVVGKPITRQQAAQVLLATDYYIASQVYGASDGYRLPEVLLQLGVTTPKDVECRTFGPLAAFYIRVLGGLDLQFLHNHQISSSWIGGLHGWCHPDGTIFCNRYNIGKWPKATDVYADWELIAERFPFLELQCQVLDHEIGCEDSPELKPLLQFNVAGGKVEECTPSGLITTPMSPAEHDKLIDAHLDSRFHDVSDAAVAERFADIDKKVAEIFDLVYGTSPRPNLPDYLRNYREDY